MNSLLKTGIGSTLATLTVAALSASANATTITFDPISGQLPLPLNTPFVEGGFTYQAVENTGGDFTSALGAGNPAPALSTLFASNGDTIAIEFSRTDGGLFTFDSFQSIFSGSPGGTSDAWAFLGFVGGTPTEVFGFATSLTSFTTQVPTFTAPIDKLGIQFSVASTQGPLIVDNLVLTLVAQPPQSVPEPTALLGLLAVGALGAVSRKRKG